MQIDLYVYDVAGKLQPIVRECPLPIVPRIGETRSAHGAPARRLRT